MEASVGDIVVSKNGRDKGVFFVIMSVENEYAYISNGSSRKSDKPKKKKLKHLKFGYGNSQYLSAKLAKGEKPTNTELRIELQEYTLRQD